VLGIKAGRDLRGLEVEAQPLLDAAEAGALGEVAEQHQVERQRRIGEALAIDGAARRQAGIAPSLVGRHLVEEEVEPRRLVDTVEVDRVRRHRADIDGAAHRRSGFDEAVVEQVAQNRADGADGERRTHPRPPLSRR